MFGISIKLPPELKREFSYLTGTDGQSEPAMFIYREGLFGRSAAIALSSAWMYDEPHKKTPEQLADTFMVVVGMMQHLGIDLSRQMTQKFLMFIQDGLDQLVKMPPAPVEQRVIGEADVWINGSRHSTQIIH